MRKLFVLLVMLVATNASAQWEPDVRLTNANGSSYTSWNNAWCIAVNENVVHIVWHDERDNFGEIYYKQSTNGGINWKTDTRLTNNSANSILPSIAVSGSIVHVVWNDERDGNNEIYYKRSADGGINWGADTRLTNNSNWSMYPSIAVSGSNVHTVWFDDRDGNNEIYYKQSTNGGTTWGTDTRLTNNGNNSLYPSIAVTGSNVHIVWYDSRDGNNEVYYKQSIDNGATWGTDTRLTNNGNNSWYPSIVVTGSNVNVVWEDWRDGTEIYYKRSTDGGINWGVDIRLTDTLSISQRPSIAISGSLVHIVWYDYRDGNTEIYYKYSSNGGTYWGADIRLTNNNAFSLRPSIAVYGSLVHVVWYDGRDGNDEIYYKRNPTGNVGIQNISTEIPSAFSLSQNYPNPFNPTTHIKFSIIKTEQVKLIVYDVQGREVQTLVNELLKPGTYEVTFNIESATEHRQTFGSGVYFYKLITVGFSETKRMILIK